MRIGAVDIGTNSVHLLVAEIDGNGQITTIEKAREQVMLGSGGIGRQQITDEAFNRGVEALRTFRAACDSLDVVDVHAAATSAVREASNGQAFCRAVKSETGIHVRVITGMDEARLIYLGAKDHLDFTHGRVLLVDLGGGSTEVVLCDRRDALHLQSLTAGHIRLTEAHVGPSGFDDEARRAMKKTVRGVLKPLLQRVRPEDVGSVVGTSGAIRCLARMATLARGEALPSHGNGLVLHRKEIEQLVARFVALPTERTVELPGMDPRRVQTLPAAAVLVREVLKALGLSALVTSDRSLRDGLVVDWILRNRPEIDLSAAFPDPRRRSVVLAMRRFGVDASHARHVAATALELFDRTADLHRLPATDRALLRDAALLHDIGHHIAGKGHHKHGQYLLQHIRLYGFNAPEVAVLSNVVRYHNGSKPKLAHPAFAALPAADRQRVRVMAGLLSLADGFDRSHEQPVRGLEVLREGGGLQVVAHAVDRADLERWSVDHRRDLLARALGRDLRVTIRPVEDGAEVPHPIPPLP